MEKRYPPFRKLFMALIFILFVASGLQAQDVIVKNDKSEIQAKVLEITDDAVKYKQFQFQDGPVYNIRKAEVFMILYQNGNRETFSTLGNSAVNNQTLSTIIAAEPLPVNEAKAKGKIVKNPSRIILAYGAYKQDGYPEKAPKIAYERVYANPGVISGIGFSSDNFLDMFWIRYNNMVKSSSGGMTDDGSGTSSIETIYGSKHYLSGYAFKEFDTKFISAGILAGPALNFTQGTYSADAWDASRETYSPQVSDTDASFFTGGLHTGIYLHKYLSTNKKGEKNFFFRLSFEQFVMAKGSYGSIIGLNFGL
ncbi:hypothetical protein [Adhaeribacter terreus]|uniref:Outer membrane protein beta-barrel domain-containing protein n=1 Tax=Adhaeribacter terreus TaxID=529703 RepID=A0ABW0E4P6_9BACT